MPAQFPLLPARLSCLFSTNSPAFIDSISAGLPVLTLPAYYWILDYLPAPCWILFTCCLLKRLSKKNFPDTFVSWSCIWILPACTNLTQVGLIVIVIIININ